MHQSRTLAFFTCLGFLITLPATADQPKTKKQKELQRSQQQIMSVPSVNAINVNAPPVTANQRPLTMNGYRDTAGLKRVAEQSLDQWSLQDTLSKGLDTKWKTEFAQEFKQIREMEDMIRGGGLNIERVEFIPGWGNEATPEMPNTSFDKPGYDAGEFGPTFPTGNSLVEIPTSTTWIRNPDGGYTEHHTYSDLSWFTRGSYTDGDGNLVEFLVVASTRGTEYMRRVTFDGETGEILQLHEEQLDNTDGSDGKRGEAYRWVSEEQKREQAAEPDTGDSSGSGDDETEKPGSGDDETEKPGKDVNKYQPSEDGQGVFCPLTVEICRRQLDKALASGKEVLTGMVLVNPGDPDVQPEAPRLIYKPRDLVINPSPEASSSNRNVDPSKFKMVLPVWVNPPGPGED